jgi:hypothetical protein
MKNILTKLLVACVLVNTIGCAKKVWVNPNVTSDKANQDMADCKYDSVKYGHVNMWGTGVGAGIEQGLREVEIISTCMSTKGYKLESLQEMSDEKKAIQQRYALAVKKREEKFAPISNYIVNVCRPLDDIGYIKCLSEKKNEVINSSFFPDITADYYNELKEFEQQLIRKEINRQQFRELGDKLSQKEMNRIKERGERDINNGVYTAVY